MIFFFYMIFYMIFYVIFYMIIKRKNMRQIADFLF
jgi:hypothetical protein